jgi:hypothetical protein
MIRCKFFDWRWVHGRHARAGGHPGISSTGLGLEHPDSRFRGNDAGPVPMFCGPI